MDSALKVTWKTWGGGFGQNAAVSDLDQRCGPGDLHQGEGFDVVDFYGHDKGVNSGVDVGREISIKDGVFLCTRGVLRAQTSRVLSTGTCVRALHC